MKFKTTALAAVLAGIAVAGTAQAGVLSDSASAFSYDSIGISYQKSTTDFVGGFESKKDSLALKGSVSIAPNFFATGSVSKTEFKDSDYESVGMSVGLGYHRDLGLSIPVDFVGQVGVSASQGELDEEWYGKERDYSLTATTGLRSNLGIQGLDASAFIGVAEYPGTTDLKRDYSFAFTYGVSADYFVTPEVTVGLAYAASAPSESKTGIEDASATSFSVKYHF